MKYNLENGRLMPRGQYILLKYGGTRPTPAEGFHVAFDGWEISGQYIVPKYKTVANATKFVKASPSQIPILDGNTEMKIRVVTNSLGDKTLEVINATQEES